MKIQYFVQVLHKTSSTPIPSFSLRPHEVIELRVRAKLRPETRLNEKFEGTLAFGRIGILSNLYLWLLLIEVSNILFDIVVDIQLRL